MNEYFFSVCIPASNRAATICRALKSVAEQSFRDFELIIVDCNSNDNTTQQIEKFFKSEEYFKSEFPYKFKKMDYIPNGTEDWNEPLKIATGKYIAMLEGDDYWLPDHLMNAFQVLSKHPEIGVYGSSNLEWKRPWHGLRSNDFMRKYCYMMKEGTVPPSESIFIRCNNNSSYLYKCNDYMYSPEIALYLDIALDGYKLYYSELQDVFRTPSTNPDKLKTWYYFRDRFVLIKKYGMYFSNLTVLCASIYNSFIVIYHAICSKSLKKFTGLVGEFIQNVDIFITVISFCMFPFFCVCHLIYKVFHLN